MDSIGNNFTASSAAVNPPEYSGTQNATTLLSDRPSSQIVRKSLRGEREIAFISESLRKDRDVALAAIVMGQKHS